MGVRSDQSFHHRSGVLPDADDGDFWTFDAVETRLVEAVRNMGRMPDRERGWLSTATMALWRQVKREWGDYVDSDEAPRKPGLTRREVAEMEEALGWVMNVPEGDSRRIMGLALRQLAREESTRVAWTAVRRAMPDGASWTTDGLRMRYSRAITMICNRLNAAENRA
jgi:hypothetical protein